ncbi:MAG TPA: carbamoyltransferase [Candidatus Nanoarchaeia archaeon]|nr:carbamoyltransferase [Candidatus Nanoarchaeia archaeon]
MPMYILGISCFYHDSSAALLKDGIVVAAAEEERFSRKKHDSSFPINAIKYCLQSQNISVDDLEYIAFYEKPFLKLERMLSQHLAAFPYSLKTFLSSIPSWINEKLRVPKIVRKRLKYKKGVLFIDHHIAHAASSFLVSPFNKAAVVTVDGVGEWTTTTYGIAEGNDIILLKEIRFPHSLGLLYSTVTAYLGFSVNNSEYKIMGLAPYGNMDRKTNQQYKRLRNVIDIKPDGSYRMIMDYFAYHYADRMLSGEFCELMGGKIRNPSEELSQRHKDIAAAVQLITEDVMTLILKNVAKTTECDNLVLAGGVALNSVYNGKILRNTPFKRLWIQPNASDGGTSIGAAAFVYHSLLRKKRVVPLTNAYLGPSFSDAEIKEFLDSNKIRYSTLDNDKELVSTTARLIHDNNVIGWFQGRMEWGPRALGARSILSNPCNKKMIEILNLKVKHREKFRPFAPAVCADDALKYFDCDNPVPAPTDYMLMVYPVRGEWRKKIPAVTHVDGSGRLQTVRKEQNPRYYDLIKEFGKLSGIPILINTSFNIRGEPIVCTPEDAYRCMMGTGIDCLIIGKFVIWREDNLKDAWNSEKYAKD